MQTFVNFTQDQRNLAIRLSAIEAFRAADEGMGSIIYTVSAEYDVDQTFEEIVSRLGLIDANS